MLQNRSLSTKAFRCILLCCVLLAHITLQAQTPRFKVIAFYNGTYDAAHINFVQEANQWFPGIAAQYNFSYEATNNWNNLNATFLSQYQVVLFLDDAPTNATQRAAFQTYMQNGGAWMGFHVCAFTTNAGAWSWYNNTFLGSGNFQSNTWGPTTAILRCEDQTHPSTQQLPQTFTSAVSEWYSWSNDLRNNSNINILCSIDPASFPLGTDPNQSWYSGYYPVIWTNKNYKMLYANFGHNDMNYSTNTGKSSTFASAIQNKFIIDGLLWLGGVPAGPAPAIPIPGTVQAENFTTMSGIQTETTTDTGGGLNVGYTDAGDWIDYKVNVQSAGAYTVQYRVASQTTAGTIQLKKDTTVLATTTLPVTGAWQTWTTVNTTVNLSAGEQTLRLQVVAGGFNLNWISFAANTPVTAPVGSVITLRGNNNLYVSGENGTQAMRCTRTAPQTWEQFSVLAAPGGKISLRSMAKYVSSENGATAITCNRATVGSYEQFDWIQHSDGTISLRGNNGRYVSSENGAAAMTCTRTTIDAWEKFNFSIVGPVASAALLETSADAVSGSSSLTASKTADAAAFPNPFQSQLYYSLPANVTMHAATLYDISGRAQVRNIVKMQQTRYVLEAGKLPTGTYILEISAKNYHKRYKVQKTQ
ncbi:Por secretion system C-terminal sorting domain-containing protein [Chitinophaga jiangningensis]|uniref:Por secretion system C-terminal sorting domain-containing protein n=1 Tax=Chitinophaga jiangningensis TaxID=1419482 RepID=A0A1M7M8Q7_9BACT|nr:carbohydrate-binding protein [Chitinophaga jiangningensis]SHM87165.1 Por secretion system C-terminal sorting domain-containing protein [Chitinophaga jiangningensis]